MQRNTDFFLGSKVQTGWVIMNTLWNVFWACADIFGIAGNKTWVVNEREITLAQVL